MEMRARESVNMSEDLTGAIAPYATALHDVFLHSHCSSCFSKLPPQSPGTLSCTTCCSVRYCSSECLSSDSLVHSSSGECCFFMDHLKRASPNYVTEGTSDLRAALRLLYVLEMHDLVSSDSINQYSRIGGLSASGIEEALEEDEEIAEGILEGSLLMSSSRKSRAPSYVSLLDGVKVEMITLWAVITNSVEVQLSEGLSMGIAVYGPSFSWFNHSCFPNASYRFVLAPKNEDCTSHQSKSCVVPASKGVAADVWHAWQYEEADFTNGNALCKYGPRVVVRCTKPINKGDEVCITYIDLLQTKEARHSDLWLKYKFICSCNRCISVPEPYVDLILNCDARDLNKPEDAVAAPTVEDLDDDLQQAITEYSSGDDAKACCDMIESMLSENLMRDLQKGELSGRKHILHPLHRVCFTAYMALASAYRFRALSYKTGSLYGEKSDDLFRMAKAAAAYSLVLAGAMNHLFLSECSFMMPLSHFLIGAGQSLFFLVKSMKGETRQYLSEAKFTFPLCPESSAKLDSVKYNEFRLTCEGFGKRMLSLSFHCWPFLVQGLPCLEKIKNPIDFSWLGTAIFPSLLSEEGYANLSAHNPTPFTKEQKECILSLAICCVTYCKYLTSICYGPQHYLADHAKDILEATEAPLLMKMATTSPARMTMVAPAATRSPVRTTMLVPAATSPARAITVVGAATTSPAPAVTTVVGAATTSPALAVTTVAGAATRSPAPKTTVAGAATTSPAPKTTVAGAATTSPAPATTVAGAATTSPAPAVAVAGAATTVAGAATTSPAPTTTAAGAATTSPALTTVVVGSTSPMN